MQFGFGVLRLDSTAFWALSLPELIAAMAANGVDQRTGISAESFRSLQAKFPDAETNT